MLSLSSIFHDASLLDEWLGTSCGQIKPGYSTIMGLALILFTIIGFGRGIGQKECGILGVHCNVIPFAFTFLVRLKMALAILDCEAASIQNDE